MKEVTLILPAVNPVLHAHNKGNRYAKAAAIKALREAACFITRCNCRSKWSAATIAYRFYFPDRRRRDAANAVQATKPAIDGIVDAGLIPDDDWTHLKIVSVECSVDQHNPRVELTLKECDKVFNVDTNKADQ